MKVLITKAGALYELCEFENSLIFFCRAQNLAPDSKSVRDGIMKCRKTILNKLEYANVFNFKASKQFIDLLQEKGDRGAQKYFSSRDAKISFKSAANIVKNVLEPKNYLKRKGENREMIKQGQNADNRMKKDRDFLKSLQKSIVPTPQCKDNSVR